MSEHHNVIKPVITNISKDSSNPWYEQITKTVHYPGESTDQKFYAIRPTDYVSVLAQTQAREIVVIRQYRPAIEDFAYELPSGHLEDGETPAQAAVRELKEETNCTASDIILLGENYPDTGRLANRQWTFYTKDIKVNEFPDHSENEGIEVFLVTEQVFAQMIRDGRFRHALDLCVVAQAIARGLLPCHNMQ